MPNTEPKRGRPGRAYSTGERVPLGLRVTTKVKEKLDGAAKLSGRSQSMEAELRLEQSFRSEDAMLDALDLAYGREATALLLILGRVMHMTGTRAAFVSQGVTDSDNWMDDPFAFDQCIKAVNTVLAVFRPERKADAPTPLGELGDAPQDSLDQLGDGFAKNVLLALQDPNQVKNPEQWAGRIMENVTERLRPRLADVDIEPPNSQ